MLRVAWADLLLNGTAPSDDTHFKYVLSALCGPLDVPSTNMAADWPMLAGSSPSPAVAPGLSSDDCTASLISSVKDLLPDLGDGFVEVCTPRAGNKSNASPATPPLPPPQACLKEYGGRPEVVINHILEGTLSPRLAAMDTSTPRSAPHSNESFPHV